MTRFHSSITELTSWKNSSTPFSVQKDGAKDSSYMLQPGENFPSEASGLVSSDSSAETSGSKATSDVAGLAPPTIAGIALGVLGMCCVILAILFTLCIRYRGRKRVKLVGTPAPSSSTETSTTTRDMIPEQIHGQVPCQILDRTVNQTSGQVPCMSPCSPESPYGFLQSCSSPLTQHPVEICSKSKYELPVPDAKDLRAPR